MNNLFYMGKTRGWLDKIQAFLVLSFLGFTAGANEGSFVENTVNQWFSAEVVLPPWL